MAPKRRNSPDADSVRDQLNEVFGAVSGPNPLETLGLTPEAVQRLSGEPLDTAVKGLYRAYQRAYHPDAQEDGGDASGDPRMRPIQAAYDQYGEDPIKTREVFLKQAREKRKSSAKNSGAKSSDTTTIRSRRAGFQMAKESQPKWISNFNTDHYNLFGTNILRLKEATVLLKPLSLVGDVRLPYESLRIDDTKLSSTSYHVADSIEPLPEALTRHLRTGDATKSVGIFVHDGVIKVSDWGLRGTSKPEELELNEDGWYEVRGETRKDSTDPRTLLVYKKSGAGNERAIETQRVIGSFPFAAWRDIRDNIKRRRENELGLPSSSEVIEVDAPATVKNIHQTLGANVVRGLLTAEAADTRLVPRLVEGNMLVSTNGGGEFFVLGKIKQFFASYYGED